MRHLFTILVALFLCAPAQAQTLKSVMLDTNGAQVNPFGNGGPTNPSVRIGTNNFGFSRGTGPDRVWVVVNGATAATFFSNSVSATTFNGNVSGAVTIGSGQAITFSGGANVAGTRTNLGLGATWLTDTNVTNFRTAIGLGATNDVAFNSVNVTNAAATRTNIGLPLSALTNASNVTVMRALAGSTNTSEPYSGTFDFQDFSDNTVRLTISNGIILKIEFP